MLSLRSSARTLRLCGENMFQHLSFKLSYYLRLNARLQPATHFVMRSGESTL